MLINDIDRCIYQLSAYPWYVHQPQHVQDALVNMCFNRDLSKLLTFRGFRKMIVALTTKNYTQAAIEALDSDWAQQVGQRAKDVALMIRQG